MGDNVEINGPNYAHDGLVIDSEAKQYISQHEIQPWFQLQFVEAMIVKGVTITNRIDCCGEKFKNVAIHVGNQPAVVGALVANPECAFFEGSSATGRIEKIMCKKPMMGRYLQVQMRDTYNQYLQINEIDVSYEIGNYSNKKVISRAM
jgi:hypothetical protein